MKMQILFQILRSSQSQCVQVFYIASQAWTLYLSHRIQTVRCLQVIQWHCCTEWELLPHSTEVIGLNLDMRLEWSLHVLPVLHMFSLGIHGKWIGNSKFTLGVCECPFDHLDTCSGCCRGRVDTHILVPVLSGGCTFSLNRKESALLVWCEPSGMSTLILTDDQADTPTRHYAMGNCEQWLRVCWWFCRIRTFLSLQRGCRDETALCLAMAHFNVMHLEGQGHCQSSLTSLKPSIKHEPCRML